MFIFVITSVIFFLIIAFTAERRAPKEYSSKENTVWELACQNYENKIIMQWGYRGLGIILASGLFINFNTTYRELHYFIPLLLFSIFIFISGIFGTKPFEHLVFYSIKEFKLNSLFRQLAGFSLYLLIVMRFIVEIGIFNRVLNIIVLITLLIFSALGNRKGPKRGVYNRLQYLVSFLWLIYSSSPMMN